jgi:hypothetical protein
LFEIVKKHLKIRQKRKSVLMSICLNFAVSTTLKAKRLTISFIIKILCIVYPLPASVRDFAMLNSIFTKILYFYPKK